MHPLIDDILKPTYGVIVYQEQVMQIAQKLANYSLGGADLLRRAMGKKKKEEMDRQMDIFLDGAKANEVDGQKAREIFELVAQFAKYGFNRSHSAGYALVTYQSAYLKAHYPAEFLCALMTADREKTEKVVRMIDGGSGDGGGDPCAGHQRVGDGLQGGVRSSRWGLEASQRLAAQGWLPPKDSVWLGGGARRWGRRARSSLRSP